MEQEKELRVRVVDVDIRFWSLVNLLVKVSLASIPAMLIIMAFVAGIGGIFGVLHR